MSLGGINLNKLFGSWDKEMAVDRAAREPFPRVLYRIPRTFRPKGDRERWTYGETELCDLAAWDMDGRKNLMHGSTAYRWSSCDVRLLSPEAMAKLDAFEAAMKNLRAAKARYERQVFFDLDPVDYETIRETRSKWSEMRKALRVKLGLSKE